MRRCEMIAQAGRAMYGNCWQSQLARDCGVDARTARRWAKGECEPTDEAMTKALCLLLKRSDTISEAIVAISAALEAVPK